MPNGHRSNDMTTGICSGRGGYDGKGGEVAAGLGGLMCPLPSAHPLGLMRRSPVQHAFLPQGLCSHCPSAGEPSFPLARAPPARLRPCAPMSSPQRSRPDLPAWLVLVPSVQVWFSTRLGHLILLPPGTKSTPWGHTPGLPCPAARSTLGAQQVLCEYPQCERTVCKAGSEGPPSVREQPGTPEGSPQETAPPRTSLLPPRTPRRGRSWPEGFWGGVWEHRVHLRSQWQRTIKK